MLSFRRRSLRKETAKEATKGNRKGNVEGSSKRNAEGNGERKQHKDAVKENGKEKMERRRPMACLYYAEDDGAIAGAVKEYLEDEGIQTVLF